jgi:hypothetical protein
MGHKDQAITEAAFAQEVAELVGAGALTDEQAEILGRLSRGPVDWSAVPELRAVNEHTRFAVERLPGLLTIA